jgi:hypothetical protein
MLWLSTAPELPQLQVKPSPVAHWRGLGPFYPALTRAAISGESSRHTKKTACRTPGNGLE